MAAISDVRTGHATTFTTAGFTGQITSISPGAQSCEVLPTTYLGSSGAHTKIPGDLVMNEPWTIEFQYVPGLTQPTVATTAASCTIAFPIGTLAGQGFFSSFTPGEITTDQVMTASATWEWAGVVTYTSGA